MVETDIVDLGLAEGEALAYDLPAETEQLLQLAAAAYHRPYEAQRYLFRAVASAPDRLEVYVACYRFYLYQNDLAMALEFAQECLELAARRLGLPRDWRRVRPGDADFNGHPVARFFLHALKAYGYLCLRLGRDGEARESLGKLLSLDPADRFGGSFLWSVAQKGGAAENEDA